MNLTEHPATLAPSRTGHSIGRWDNDVLVVDTSGFLPGTLRGVTPHSERLHVVERFTLDPATLMLRREYTASDSLFFAGEYSGTDSMALSVVPYSPEPCQDLTPVVVAPR